MPRMTVQDIHAFLEEHFPQALETPWTIEAIADGRVDVRLACTDRFLRPGGTLSGPTLMTLADTAMYFLVLSMIGPAPLAVTSNLSISFLRRPAPRDVLARAELLKLGSRLAVGQVTMRSDGDDALIAHATVTYSLPPSAGPGGARATGAWRGPGAS
jgi:uncharacterized protein (TIGR00369 family)